MPVHNFIKNKKGPLKNKITCPDNPGNDVRQFQEVLENWKQLLNSRMEENVLLKNKLADLLKNNFDFGQNSLEEIEEFQTQFIMEDELIHLLRRDVKDLDNLLYDKMFEDKKMGKLFDTKMESLRKDIANSVTRFGILQSSFDDFQHKIVRKREN